MKRCWTDLELAEHFTLFPNELALLTSTTEHNRLGFAVLLKCFEYEGRFPPNPSSVAKDPIRYLAKQLNVAPEVFEQYDFSGRSIRQHRAQIRQWLGFRPYVESDRGPLIEWLRFHVLPENQNLEFLIERIYQHLRHQQIEPPTRASIERIIRSAIQTYENEVFDSVYKNLPATVRQRLDELLISSQSETEQSETSTPFHQIKTCYVRVSLNSVLQAAKQLERLQQINLPSDLFALISPKVIERFRQRAAVESPSQLRRHPENIRYTLLAAFCLSRQSEITDDLVECLIQIVHKISTKAERKIYKELLSDLKHVSGKTNLLFQIAEVSLENPDGRVKEVIYPIASEQKLRDLVAEYHSSGPAYRRVVHRVMRGSYSRHYRRMVPELLRVLDFQTNNTAQQPVTDALELLRKYTESQQVYYPTDEEIPIDGVVRPSEDSIVIESNNSGEPRINRINYEMCVLSSLRDGLRNKSIWVASANRYRNPDEDLPTDFEQKRMTYYQALDQPLDATTFTTRLRQQMRNALVTFNDNLPRNDRVGITERNGGWISLTPLDPQPDPPQLIEVKREIAGLWSMTSLLDILKETDLRVDFTRHFGGIGNREILSRRILQKRHLLCLYGLGTNIGLKQVSSMTHATGLGEKYTDLRYIYQRYLHRDSLREAIRAVVNDTFRIRNSSIWGEGTTAVASDAKKFAAWDQNLLTEWHVRYHGRGVMVYWHVDQNSACIYSQLKSCSSSEVAAMIEGVLRHCTEMEVEKNYVDSHGQSEIGFAFCHLLGFELLPRLKGIGRARLYRPDKGEPDAYPNLQPILTRPINWPLIEKHYDEMIKYATALRLGTAEADAILKRFSRRSPQHPTYRALAELGKVVKTIFLCRYLSDEALRREIHDGLNVIESWNSANDFILIGKGGEISSNRLQAQELTVLSMHLLQASLVYINTLMIQKVLADPKMREKMTFADWRALTPLFHHHVNPYGAPGSTCGESSL